ncbi:hypothetical protein PHYSODRAFT_334779 [Phytophthora sojae]|uniref:Uncharacterized protein n=1 Tax=Phytophthora sojae (strain P6497) TaxID=1094619 RepID=G4ZTN6_PHYSP|nr:hypothetical protein PHYSODRAFT_334779 [Phytophthora sojae]EGZ12947.1 hypothetical protein PHYSODRAFT_334779 [Phytophthora sojae]|eukprot:XP_009530376.1 hypothetical protein PHYSODRAFT_334779 [Phytophthora sojae]
MARPSLQVGGYLLLRPEDAPGTLTRLAYASIVGVARAKVVVKLAEDLSDDGPSPRSYRYGQVRGYSGSKLDIWTAQGAMSVTRRQLVGEVHPLLAMTLGHQDWPKRAWPKTRLQELHERLMAKLGTLGAPATTPPTAPEWLQELASDMDVERLATAQVEWVNALS